MAASELATKRKTSPRPKLSNGEILAMSRMLRLYFHEDKFFNPLAAMDTKRLAESGMNKLEAWRSAILER